MKERIEKNTNNERIAEPLVRYGMQLAMLNKLLADGLVSPREHSTIKARLMKDYKITA